MSALEVVFAIGLGLFAGAFAGLLGVGGGIVMIPAMVVVLEQTQKVAQGTSLLVIVATAIVATRANARRGLLERRDALSLAVGGMIGAVGGSLLALHVLEEQTLRRIFGAFVIAAALWLLVPLRGTEEQGPRVP